MDKKLTFEEWMKKVDEAIEALVMMSHGDLPDWGYADAWADGMSPKAAARAAVKNAKDEK